MHCLFQSVERVFSHGEIVMQPNRLTDCLQRFVSEMSRDVSIGFSTAHFSHLPNRTADGKTLRRAIDGGVSLSITWSVEVQSPELDGVAARMC